MSDVALKNPPAVSGWEIPPRVGDLVRIKPRYQSGADTVQALVVEVRMVERKVKIAFCGWGIPVWCPWEGVERTGSVWDLPWPE